MLVADKNRTEKGVKAHRGPASRRTVSGGNQVAPQNQRLNQEIRRPYPSNTTVSERGPVPQAGDK